MSSLLEQAIVDAKALKEAAMKNAEATIIDKYSEEVKSTLNQLLEQDELEALLGGGEETPSADAEAAIDEEVEADEIAEGVPDAFTEDSADLGGVNEGDAAEVTIDFKELAEALNQLREGIEEEETLEEAEEDDAEPVDEEIELDEESIMEMVSSMLAADSAAAEEESDSDQMEKAGLEENNLLREEYHDCKKDGFSHEECCEQYPEDCTEDDLYEELSDGLLDAIMEKLTVDMGATLGGWAGRSEEAVKHQMELEMAHRRSTDVEEELEALKKAQEELVFENKKLKQNLSNYQEVVESLKENVQDVNLSNARLLYTNRTLRNTSLNERQKERIVEAISKAGSVEEAKTIHETLQSTVGSTPKRGPKSLSEAITRPTSVIRASRKEEPKADPFTARMRKLAGIN
jgi:FtsZ-binding cell division protein ZapB